MKIRDTLRSYGAISTILLRMVGFILLYLGHRDLAFSEEKNRVLQQRPATDMAAVLHDSFQRESEAWPRDQFDQRLTLMRPHASLNYILGKRELQDVTVGRSGILFQKQEKPDQERPQTKAGQLRSFAERHGDKKLSMLLVPSKSAIWKEKLPMCKQGEDQPETLKDFHKKLSAVITWVNAAAPFRQYRGEVLYYASDHRWTTRGAAVAFNAWCAAEKRERKTDYKVYMVNDQFYGILANTSGYYRDKKDHVNIYIPEKSQELVVTYVQEQQRTVAIFERDKAASANLYDTFFDSNHGLMQLDTAQSDKRLLITENSYASCFLPFLISYYESIAVVGPRYYYDDLDKLVEERGVQKILFLYNANTPFSDDSLNEILRKEMK